VATRQITKISACVAVLLAGAATGCSGSPAPPRPHTSSPAGQLGEPDSVSCPSASFCMAVDARDSATFVFDGSRWSSAGTVPGTQTGMASVSCASASFCVALDRKGKAFTFNGSTWSAPVTAAPDGLTMGEGGISWPVVSCPASDFCAAVDGSGGNVVTFDGRTWTVPLTIDSKAAHSRNGPVLIFLMSVSCSSATFCVAGDTIGDVFVRS
jgi:hypothetical protein